MFPPHTSTPSAHLEFSFLLNASLDMFDARARDRNRVDQDLGMLQAIDERLSIWGWETGTGTRFAVVVDAWGKGGNKGSRGISDGDLRGVSCCPLVTYGKGLSGDGNADLRGIQGFQGATNSLHTAVTEPVLCAG